MKNIKLYEEFVGSPTINYTFIKSKMEELSDLANDTFNDDGYSKSANFSYTLTKDDLEITLVVDDAHKVENSITLEILFDLKSLMIGTWIGHEEHFGVSSIEEGLDLIEKKIYERLGIYEKYNIKNE